ncbi:ankyrin repeat domain-containing protein [Polyangium jinanense]|uniref:Ankyrin repeat domain-containing protein n=1 Tax=Polyangium jinanense TaxID=2829994 RepID=A0A9X4AXF8_9BACT|nr:ankyrin repeat domain-containing protein [Polyangium jinanense]MDC3962878.1 ankyrin repeat domain-containing protein [Polyangium jinanense]MDC3987846.1 ankyrin repeat domain-containing protein [Polyangium jinanense]
MTLDEELLEAASRGDEARVTDALTRGANVDATRRYKTSVDREVLEGTVSALMLAIMNGHDRVAELLIDRGADPDAADELTRRTPLVEAAARGEISVVEALIDAGASLDARDVMANMNAVTAAVASGHAGIARQLVEAGAPIEPRAFEEATRRGMLDLAELFTTRGLDPNTTQALEGAAAAGRVDVLRWLLTQGVNLGKHGPEALLGAANAGKAEAVAALVEAGVPINTTTNYGWMPLHLAAYNGDAKTVRALLALGADPHADDGTGKTALDWAREAGKAESARVLEEALRR